MTVRSESCECGSDPSCAIVARVREVISELGPIQLGRFLRSDFDDVHAFASDRRPGNIGSIRVLEKAGFRREGHLRDSVIIRGERQDSLVFGKLVTEC